MFAHLFQLFNMIRNSLFSCLHTNYSSMFLAYCSGLNVSLGNSSLIKNHIPTLQST